MPETETRMSRYHGKDKHRREYEDYVKGGASQESKQADWPALEDQDQDLDQTQLGWSQPLAGWRWCAGAPAACRQRFGRA